MPMLPFLPWATISERLQFGRFHLIPTGVAIANTRVPADHGPAVRTILEAYDRRRQVDQDVVPLLRREDLAVTADLGEKDLAEYFEFRIHVSMTVLSARRFFSHRYSNSDHTRLVIQGFTPGRAGGALIQQRRRDGSTNIIIPRGHLSVTRPHHVSSPCDLAQDLDHDLLVALDAVMLDAPAWWPRISEGIRLFVGANTDAPDVSEHTELIDVVSAFSMLADAWDERGTVKGFVEAVPSPMPMPERLPEGPKVQSSRLRQALDKGLPLRAIWLRDAYRLRGNFSHGRVATASYPAIWSEREHLLLAAVAFPLYLKGLLEGEGLYGMTEEDEIMNTAFDALALLAPFETPADGDEDEEFDESQPWSETIAQVRLHRWIEGRADTLWPPDEAAGENATGAGGDASPRPDDSTG